MTITAERPTARRGLARRTSDHRSAVRALALATVVLAGIGATSSPATASVLDDRSTAPRAVEQPGAVPGGFGSWEELLAMQERLVKGADRVTAASERGASGFAGVVVAAEERQLKVFWKGELPNDVKQTLAEVRRDVKVAVHPAQHSVAELAREADRIAKKSKATETLSSIAPNADGSGLTVSVTDKSTTKARGLVKDAAVPVAVETDVAPAATSRWNDYAPWWGGAAYRNATTGGGCSTGFAVWHAGRTKMLTAGHCGAVGNRATDPTGEHMGYFSQDSNAYDVALIDARSAGRVYNNTSSLSEYSNGVIGTTSSYPGLWICTSGAYSGTRCRIQVKQTGVTINIGYWVYNTVRAEQVDYTSAAGQGDSGGPVLRVAADTTQVYAAGVVSAGDRNTAVACTGYVPSGRLCSWRMYYAPWANASGLFGTSIVTG